MCNLLRDGWKFKLQWDQLHSYTPNGHLVELRVGNDIVLRLPHTLREGVKSKELPEVHHCYSVRTNTTEEASSEFFHRLFNHAYADKVHRTLGAMATTGYKQPDKPLPSCRCEACATENSRKRSLRHTTFNVTTAMCADISGSKYRD